MTVTSARSRARAGLRCRPVARDELGEPLARKLQVEVLLRPCPSAFGKSAPVLERLAERGSRRFGVAGREQSAAALVDDLDRPAGGRGDHRHAARQRLGECDPERLALRRVQQDARGSQRLGGLDGAGELDPAGKVVARPAGDQPLDEALALRIDRGAGEPQAHVRRTGRDLERQFGPLPLDDRAQPQHAVPLGLRGRREDTEVNARRDDLDRPPQSAGRPRPRAS